MASRPAGELGNKYLESLNFICEERCTVGFVLFSAAQIKHYT
jgi:hypothetical protein